MRSPRWMSTTRLRSATPRRSTTAINRRSTSLCAFRSTVAVSQGSWSAPGCRPKRAALHGVDVEPIDNQDVIERRAQAWKETGPRRHEISLRQSCTSREQTVVGPAVVVGHGTVRKDSIHQHLRSPNHAKFFGSGRPRPRSAAAAASPNIVAAKLAPNQVRLFDLIPRLASVAGAQLYLTRLLHATRASTPDHVRGRLHSKTL